MSFLTLSDETLDAFIQEVYRSTGITMDASKRTMLTGRLRRRARALDLPSFDAYLRHLRRDVGERDAFIDAVTTNKTSMFRTPSVWRYLHDRYLPEWKSPGATFRAWSAASSSGQEAASLAALLAHHAARRRDLPWQVMASDISPEMVELAKQQTFARADVERDGRSSPLPNLLEHFEDAGDGQVRLRPELRRLMKFFRHNLFDACHERPFDLVLVRNVVIYFSPEDKQRVLTRVGGLVRPGGLLVIGESESLFDGLPGFESVGHCLYRRTS